MHIIRSARALYPDSETRPTTTTILSGGGSKWSVVILLLYPPGDRCTMHDARSTKHEMLACFFALWWSAMLIPPATAAGCWAEISISGQPVVM